MSMELWQRLKDLEKRVAELEPRIANLEKPSPVVASLNMAGAEELIQQLRETEKPEKPKKLCPKCGKVPGYFFHVKSCKG